VEIVNPGGLPSGLDSKDFGIMSVRRNLIIGDLFHRMGKVEWVGSGIGRMWDFMRAAKLEPPKFEITNFFRVIFYRDPHYSLKKSGQEAGKKGGQKRWVEKVGRKSTFTNLGKVRNALLSLYVRI
jgi:ATP-dependent DNA helicase RecG